VQTPAGFSGAYGGTDAAHDCGALEYVRVEFAGAVSAGAFSSAVQVAGCGTKTQLHHLQVHRSGGNGLEVLGGTLAVHHLLLSRSTGNGFGWHYGWVGAGQFVIVYDASAIAVSGRSDDAFNPGFIPVSAPELWNMTVVGAENTPNRRGVLIENSSRALLRDSILERFAGACMEVSGPESTASIPATTNIKNSIIFECGSATNQSLSPATLGSPGVITQDPLLPTPVATKPPSFMPSANSPAFTPPGNLQVAPVSGSITKTSYRGAVSSTSDWTLGWTDYPEQ
jgi:hypothetical protein